MSSVSRSHLACCIVYFTNCFVLVLGVSVAAIAWSTLLRNCAYSAGVASLFVKALSPLIFWPDKRGFFRVCGFGIWPPFVFVASTKCTWLPFRYF